MKFNLRKKFLFISICVISTLIFLFIFILFDRSVMFFRSRLTENALQEVEKAIDAEKIKIEANAMDLAKGHALDKAIENKDVINLYSILDNESNKRGIERIIVTDASGFVVARSFDISRRGDNLFQTTAWGHAVAEKGFISWMDASKDYPLVLGAGSLIQKNNEVIGAIFLESPFNDNFANTIKNKYLKNNNELILYADDNGAIGMTLDDPEIKQLVRAYFNPGLDPAYDANNKSIKTIKIGNEYYSLRFLPLKSTDRDGLFILIYYDRSEAVIISAIIALLFFIFSALLMKLLHINGDQASYFVSNLILTFLTFGMSFLLASHKIERSILTLKNIPDNIYNAVVNLDPEADIISRFEERRINILVNTGGEAINAVLVEIAFDPTKIEIVDIITIASFCDQRFVFEKNIDNKSGLIKIACGLLNPGFSGPNGLVAELLVRALSTEPFNLVFTEQTAVYANDGLGTDVLRVATGGSYQVSMPSIEATKNQLTIFSFSHPNSERWYSKNTVDFIWPRLKDSSYIYAINQEPEFSFLNNFNTDENNIKIEIKKDGIYYLHVMSGPDNKTVAIGKFKIKIDTLPPEPPIIRQSHQTVKEGDIVTFTFSSKDELSGLQPTYYFKVNNGLLLPVVSPLHIPFIKSGSYSITVRAFDNAGNFNESSTVVTVVPK